MFCKNCGRQLDENENVCPVCGTVHGGETATAPTVEYGYDTVDVANEQMKNSMAGQALIWGILSLAFSASVCLSLLGFIFSFIAKSKALAYARTFGFLEGKARAGRILGRIGFGLGLGLTIYMTIVIIAGVFVGLVDAGVIY